MSKILAGLKPMSSIADKLRLNFGCTEEEATEANMLKACAMVLRDRMNAQYVDSRQKVRKKQLRRVHYMSMEFKPSGTGQSRKTARPDETFDYAPLPPQEQILR
mgnify:CR=1 FL=1